MPPPNRVPRSGVEINVHGDRVVAASAGRGLRTVGGNTDHVDLIAGLTGYLADSQAVLHEMRNIARDMNILANRTAAYTGDTQQQSAVRAQTVGLGTITAPRVPVPAAQGPTDAYADVGVSPVPPASPPRPTRPRHSTAPRGPAGASTPEEADPQGYGPSYVPSAGPPGSVLPGSWQEGKQFSLGKLRQNVAGGIDRWMTQRQFGDFEIIGGRYYAPGSQGQALASAMNPGAGIEMPVAESASGARVLSGIKNYAGSLAGGQGPGEALASAAPGLGRALGVAGAVYMGVNKGLDFAEGQRSANARYQQVLGGGNAEGFGERAQQNLFRLGLRGTMDGAEAEQLYQGALDLYAGNRGGRQRAMDVGTRLYSDLGVGPEETLRMLKTMVSTGNDSLYALANSIEAVSKSARVAGENAAEARKRFEEALKTTTQQYQGVAAVQIAQQQATSLAAFGTAGNAMSLSGLNTGMAQAQQASLLNMPVNTYAAKIGLASGYTVGPGGVRQLQGSALAMQGQRAQIQQYLGPQVFEGAVGNKIRAILRDRLSKNGGTFDQGVAQAVAQEVMLDPQVAAQLPPGDVMQGILSMAGIEGSTPGESFGNAINAYYNEEFLGPDKDLQEINAKFGTTAGSAADQGALNAIRGGDSKTMTDTGAAPDILVGAATAIGGTEKTKKDFAYAEHNTGGGQHETAMRHYYQLVSSTNKRYGILEEYLKNNYHAEDRFQITDKDGKKREVTPDDLILHYADQAQADPSSIIVTQGKRKGQTLADKDLTGAMGFRDTSVDPTAAGGSRNAETGTTVGKELSKEDIDKRNEQAGAITLEASAWLRKLIDIKTSGRVVDSQSYPSQQQGVPSPPPRNDQLPTGDTG